MSIKDSVGTIIHKRKVAQKFNMLDWSLMHFRNRYFVYPGYLPAGGHSGAGAYLAGQPALGAVTYQGAV